MELFYRYADYKNEFLTECILESPFDGKNKWFQKFEEKLKLQVQK